MSFGGFVLSFGGFVLSVGAFYSLLGRGDVEPGTALTYDSDEYIQHISLLLNTTAPAGQTARGCYSCLIL